MPGVNRALSIESDVTTRAADDDERRPEPVTLPDDGAGASGCMTVGEKESSSKAPQDGQDNPPSGMSCEQSGHLVIGGPFYHHLVG